MIFLAGFMGSGKSTVASALAERLGWSALDLDRVIEAEAGRTIAEIFRRSGEAHFRRLESAALEGLGASARVVALGGGAPTLAENRRAMRRTGASVWLKPSLRACVERLGGHDTMRRPLMGEQQAIRRLYRERLPHYGESTCRLDLAPSESVGETVERVLRALEKA